MVMILRSSKASSRKASSITSKKDEPKDEPKGEDGEQILAKISAYADKWKAERAADRRDINSNARGVAANRRDIKILWRDHNNLQNTVGDIAHNQGAIVDTQGRQATILNNAFAALWAHSLVIVILVVVFALVAGAMAGKYDTIAGKYDSITALWE
jgi:hypothetical protein